MPIDINKHEVDIENLFKQNANDLSSIKELYRKLEEMEKKISQIKYINNVLVNKLKRDYENLKRIILDENIQVQLTNDINELNSQLDTMTTLITNDINELNSQLDTKANINEIKEQFVMRGEQKGNFENGSVLSILSNTDKDFRPQICGYKTSLEASKYPDRDSVALFAHNENRNATLYCSNCSYTENTVTIPKSYDLSLVNIGMTIETQGEIIYTGLITNIDLENNIITVEDSWYVWDGTGTKGKPSTNTPCVINQTTGIWGLNANVALHNDTEGNKATLAEFGVLNYKPYGIAGGVNVISMGTQQIQYGFWSRATTQSPKVLHGFLNQKVTNAFSNRTDSSTDVLLRSTDLNDNFDVDKHFRILNDGTLSKLKLKTQIISSNDTNILEDTGTVLAYGSININMPNVSCKYGSYLTITNIGSSELTLTSTTGNFVGVGINTGFITLPPFHSITVISDKSRYFIVSTSSPIQNIANNGEIRTKGNIISNGNNIVAKGEQSMLKTSESAYNKGHLQLGAYHIWVDSNGRLRIHNQQPTSDTDGWIVGVQS